MSAAGSVAEEECFLSPTMMRGLSSTSAESATDADDPPAFADAHAGQPSGNQHATTVGVAETILRCYLLRSAFYSSPCQTSSPSSDQELSAGTGSGRGRQLEAQRFWAGPFVR